MSKIIIGIHGMGNKPDILHLQTWWKAALTEGLKGWRAKGFFRFKMVYWASVLHDRPLDASIEDSDDPLFLKEPYDPAKTGFEELSVEKPLFRKIRDQINEQLDKIILEEDGSVNFSRLSDFILRHFVKDLDAYYRSGSDELDEIIPRERICRLLVEILRKHKRKKIMLIAHSMGSIIAWDVLSRMVPEVKIHTFVTIGSPLGIPFVRSRMLRDSHSTAKDKLKLKTPENITNRWCNLADFRDKVAFSYDLHEDFLANSKNVRPVDKLVRNNYEYEGVSNYHKSYGYLRCGEMSDLIKDFLISSPFKKIRR